MDNMNQEKLEESILLAEELAEEICSDKKPTSQRVQEWKEKAPELYEAICQRHEWTEQMAFHDTVDIEKALEQMHVRLGIRSRRRKMIGWMATGIAASVAVCLGVYLWLSATNETPSAKSTVEWISALPASGQSLITATDEALVLPAGDRLKVESGQLTGLSEEGVKNVSITLKHDGGFNKLSVAAGTNYLLTLEDGTEVQVNADSELWFPTRFNGAERHVMLYGEACFHVNADPEHPFHVQAGGMDICVTGTVFNVRAYSECDEVRVSLTEGALQVMKEKLLMATLSPGDVFTYHKSSGRYEISGDVSSETAWTEGHFIFHNETIEHIMHELAHWYGVEIHIDPSIKEIHYSGILSRKQPFREIMDALRLTGELEFKVYPDRKIDVMKK